MKCSLSVKSLHYKRNMLLYGGERGCFVWDFCVDEIVEGKIVVENIYETYKSAVF